MGDVIWEVTRPGPLTCIPEGTKVVRLLGRLVLADPGGGGSVVQLACTQPRKQSRELREPVSACLTWHCGSLCKANICLSRARFPASFNTGGYVVNLALGP